MNIFESLPGIRQIRDAVSGQTGPNFIQTEDSFLLNDQEVQDIHSLAHTMDQESVTAADPVPITAPQIVEDLSWFFGGNHSGIIPGTEDRRTEVLFSSEQQREFQDQKLREISKPEKQKKK